MGDVEQGAELVLEPQQRGRADAVHGLERDGAAAPAIKRAVDSAHAAAAQHAQDVEAVDAGPARVGGPAAGLVELDAPPGSDSAGSRIGRCVRFRCLARVKARRPRRGASATPRESE